MAGWFVYIIKDEYNSLYTGVTLDVDRRFQEHVEGGPKAAKYLKAKYDLELVYSCEIGDKSEAYRIESKIKALNKIKKEIIVKKQLSFQSLKEHLSISAK